MTATPIRRREDGPDGPLSGALWEHSRRTYAVANHSIVEGRHEVNIRAVLNSYDRVEHPYLHGRRWSDIAARIREVLPL